MRITRDYGAVLVAEARVEDPTESDTVLRVLDREADVTTRYGGGFVQSIDGIEGGSSGGRTSDWFFFVNGVESPIGAAEVPVRAGDSAWWDYRDWTDAMRAPAVVGSWPQPFAQASAGNDRTPVRLECGAERRACDEVAELLAQEGVAAGIADFPAEGKDAGEEALRVLVGPWAQVRSDETAALIEDGPAASGVFADFTRSGGGWELVPLDARVSEGGAMGEGTGLVAALRPGEEPPTWVVTGTDADGVEAAVGLLDAEDLLDHYAVAIDPQGAVPLPVGERR